MSMDDEGNYIIAKKDAHIVEEAMNLYTPRDHNCGF